jgi:hypothetical protein
VDSMKSLEAVILAAGIKTQTDFEAVALRLSPAQARLFGLLSSGPADTIRVRVSASIGNISECAASLNAKLERAGDSRRVRCELRPHQNSFGERGVLGVWRLVELERVAA